MTDNDLEISYAQRLQPLADALSQVTRPGDFFAVGTLETPMPLLTVEGVGTISFPLPKEQGKQLIESAAERAPYGRGDQTLHDESVRKVWQIDPGKIALGGKTWPSSLGTLVRRVEEHLGRPADSISAELYKLLIYDKGGFFKPHRDTEKSKSMFGTLVISLPSAHTGGDLLIRHAGRETRANLRPEDPGEICYAAFYADCEHEVLPVESGNRICLVYNLLDKQKNNSSPTEAPDYRDITDAAASQLREWARSDALPSKLVWLLEHQYTQAGLSLAGLKNRDAAIARVLRHAAETAGCCFHLGILHIEESGSAEYTGGFYGYGRRRKHRYSYFNDKNDDGGENENDDDDFEIGEIFDGDRYIAQWRDASDKPVQFGNIPLADGEILPVGALDNEKSDKLHFSEATGNEGASFERTYLRAAIVLWPVGRTDLVCATAGIDAAIERLGQRVAEVKQGSSPEALQAITLLADAIEDHWSADCEAPRRAANLFAHLSSLGDSRLLPRLWNSILLENYDGFANPALADAAIALGAEAREPILSLIERHYADQPAACIDLWIRVSQSGSRNAALQTVAPALLTSLLARLKKPAPKKKQDLYAYHFEKPPINLTPALVSEFLLTVAENPVTEKQLADAADALDPAARRFITEEHLLPALELNDTNTAVPAQALDIIWNHCATDLLKRAEFPPPIPKNWAQTISLGKTSPPLKELEAFARDPDRREARFALRKDLRRILHRVIDQHNLDMTHVTERRGSPYTLVCKKTHSSFNAKCKQHRADKKLIARLLALSHSTRQPAPLIERLKHALERSTPTVKDLPKP